MVAKQRKFLSESKRKCQKELKIVLENMGAFGTIFPTTVFKGCFVNQVFYSIKHNYVLE